MLFISPRFLFPIDSGGKIRTTQILRGMKGGQFEIHLASPASRSLKDDFAADIDAVCDHFTPWSESAWRDFPRVQRMWHAFSSMPIPVAADRSKAGRKVILELFTQKPDLVVFDFPHATVLGWDKCKGKRAIFTHNVETEIFERHVEASKGVKSLIWRLQSRKMARFEKKVLADADGVVAVSSRDADAFSSRFEVGNTDIIRTGVDLNYYSYSPPANRHHVVFTGAMDWLANIDAIRWFRERIWRHISAAVPESSMHIVGRAPPQELVNQSTEQGLPWHFERPQSL
jgi:hypothetical protein